MADFDLVIRNGMAFDGTGGPRYQGDLGIQAGVIQEIGRIPGTRAAREIDASGLHVAPSFVGTHTHDDMDKLAVGPMEVAYDFPADEWRRVQRAFGYRYIMVNGEVTIQDDKETRSHAGRLLRNNA